jgi:trehalose/maltose transport system substrate-binding protein
MDIVFSFWPDPSVRTLVDEFNQQNPSGINVIYQEIDVDTTDEYLRELRRMFRDGGSEIDVIGGDVIWPAEFASKGWISDLSGRFPQGEQNEFLDATIEANTYDDKIWGVPWFTDVGLLYYRKDLLEQSGFFSPPQTWDELKQMALQVKQDAGIQHGYVFQGGEYEGGVCNGLEYIWTHGGDVLDVTQTPPQVIINSIEAKKGLRTERSMVEDGVAPQRVHTFDEMDTEERFLDGKAVFSRNWPGMYGLLETPAHPLRRDQVGVAELPRDPGVQQGGGCLGGWNMFINAASDVAHQDAAWEFIQFMTEAAQQRRLAIDASLLPTRKALYQEQPLLNQVPILDLSSGPLNNARPRPVHPRYLDMSEEMADQFHRSLRGDIPPALAIERLRRELTDIV